MQPRPDYGAERYRGASRLDGKKALITGGDSGIGRAVAVAFARESADVAISYLPQEQSDAEETKRVVEAAGRRCLLLPGDIQDERFCRELVQQTAAELGGLDVLANIAGYQMSFESFTEIPAADIERVYRTNVFALFWLCQAAVPLMKPGASIVNTASIQAYQPSPSILHYSSSKGAIATFTKGLAQELAPKGIRVNAVAPGPIWTPLIVSTMGDSVEHFGEQAPLQRAGQPAEMAPIYVLLASNESSYVTGMIYGATGGEITA
jgi:NAD(P)-dependent dehydrogenase (short-subunit alcohol dehydrogenase family)